MSPELLVMLPLWYAAFLLSVTCHEAAHAFVAYRGGDETAYVGGQVTLNPLPHIQREMFGTVLIPLVTYMFAGWMMGWASAPYDPLWEARHPRRAAMMAAAGPASNLILALLAFAVLKWGLGAGIWIPPDSIEVDRLVLPAAETAGALEGLGRLCSVMLTLNLVLFLFNLLPVPPLDGAAVLAGLFEPARRLRERLTATPTFGLLGLVIAWTVFRRVFWPVYFPVLQMLWS